MKLPDTIKIFDVSYKVEYVDKPSEVDLYKRESLWGQCDPWTRTIRVYKNDRQYADVMQTLWHEIIHAIAIHLHIDDKVNDDDQVVDLLAVGINNVITDNGWIVYE